MGSWWLYVLVFVFGYLTHKTFYFFNSLKISIGLIRISQLISLAILAKSIENFYYSHTASMRQMREDNLSDKEIRDRRRTFISEIKNYKEKSIKEILDQHPKFYDPIINFNNWKTAMEHLDENKDYIINLLKQDKK
jgi:hypothetical protein